jgi:2-oxoisovalerate dehydrogenase E1 component
VLLKPHRVTAERARAASATSRTGALDGQLRARVAALSAEVERPPGADLDGPVRPGSKLSAREALRLFEAQIESRLLDLLARDLKNRGQSFYTIGSSGHEGNAAVAAALEVDDPAFLHYRSGAFFLARASAALGPEGAFDVALGLTASSDEPIAGGRHKVFGSAPLNVPPQTSTIASHLPKALGAAVGMERRARFEGRKERRIVACTFGDASSNHASTSAAFNTCGWVHHQKLPAPVLWVCEDNGIGISVHSPEGWVERRLRSLPGIKYFFGDGLDLAHAYDAAVDAVDFVRSTRAPAVLHLRTVRLMGHAGSDVESTYRSPEEIAADEARDPLVTTAQLLVGQGWCSASDLLDLYDDTRRRVARLGEEAVRRPRITTAAAVVSALAPPVTHAPLPVAGPEVRAKVFGEPPEAAARPWHLAVQINRALADVLAAIPEAILFGEDVAKKGGVYTVTKDLQARFGVGRVFNTLLDETSILGLAIGARHAGLLPIPEIQYLAYLMNAIDQLRGEAGSMQFFSQGQYNNGMLVRIAGLAYQKGFGGHFHNDNGVAALLEIPGIVVGCPARGDDAARMIRTLVDLAHRSGRVTVLLEPIALYMTKDLHEAGDSAWLTAYPSPDASLTLDSVGVHDEGAASTPDLTIVSFANGLYMSRRVARRLAAEGHTVRIVDLRWLAPLPHDALGRVVPAGGRVLVVDECRRCSGVGDRVLIELIRRNPSIRWDLVTGMDTYIPLADAANLVLVQEPDIDRAARALLGAP